MSRLSDFVKTNVSGQISLADGTGTPVTLTLVFDRGDLAISNLKGDHLNENVRIQRRGRHINTAPGNRLYPGVSFSAWLPAFDDSGAAPGDLITWIQRTTGSAYAGLISTTDPSAGSGPDIPFAFDLTYTLEGTRFGDSQDHTFTLHDFEVDNFSFNEAAEGISISLTGTVTGEIDGDLDMAEIA